MVESVNELDPKTAAVVDHLVPPPRSQGFALGVGVALVALAIGFVTLWFGGLFRPQLEVSGSRGTIDATGDRRPAVAVLTVHNDGWFDAIVFDATDTEDTSMTVGNAQGETGRIELPAGRSTEVTIRYTVDCSDPTGQSTGSSRDNPFVLKARSTTFPVTMDVVTEIDAPFDTTWC